MTQRNAVLWRMLADELHQELRHACQAALPPGRERAGIAAVIEDTISNVLLPVGQAAYDQCRDEERL
jgi:hypothetical protein